MGERRRRRGLRVLFLAGGAIFLSAYLAAAADELAQGLAAQKAGRHEEAVKLFGQRLKENPKDIEARRHLASSYAALGQKTEALAELDAALKQKPDDPALLLAKGKLLGEMERRPEAIALLTRILAKDGKNVEALKERGENYTQEGNLDAALKDLKRAAALAPGDPWARFKIGMVRFALGENREAVADFTRAIRLNPESPLFYFARGQVYLRHLNEAQKGILDFQAGCRLGHPLCCGELEKLGLLPKKD